MEISERVRYWYNNMEASKLEETIKKDKAKASLQEAVINLVIATIPLCIIYILITAIFGLGIGAIVGIIIAVFIMVLTPVFYIISQGIYWILARVLGGKGDFKQQAYFMALPESGFTLISPVFMIPCLGIILSLAVGFYTMYLQYVATKSIHGLSSGRAAAVVLIPFFFMLLLVVMLIMFSAIGSYSPYYMM